ncbi:UNKNOWN [Stylonychia lemnae]|uniref:Uncharacterized protein n=1 Tax=Stylonychia lemnae TaxID=5949 RepID=A0A078AM71_STYLE|nr:UNKNOWN [Stylonychia lemnae]|eukprot:CDW83485.1 UNKNOWN [Stylonychia lemnae]
MQTHDENMDDYVTQEQEHEGQQVQVKDNKAVNVSEKQMIQSDQVSSQSKENQYSIGKLFKQSMDIIEDNQNLQRQQVNTSLAISSDMEDFKTPQESPAVELIEDGKATLNQNIIRTYQQIKEIQEEIQKSSIYTLYGMNVAEVNYVDFVLSF